MRKSKSEVEAAEHQRRRREAHQVLRWRIDGGYLVGCFSMDQGEPRVYHDEDGDSLDRDQRAEGDANEGIVGGLAQKVYEEHKAVDDESLAQIASFRADTTRGARRPSCPGLERGLGRGRERC